ncbi:hypothetical protein GCM10009841_35260 [Microlunatus panaciterrae]|uniref:DUF7691 domain-containing protein n=1 Tax=Microlunatus panaciterrae TaxID=400768 RepID=A0ABS2RHM2_9ACTN|nr:hypothetical protein [Microlunatus panaciterrae]MBM7798183.1 hypothetical protein [Microlunatus panaciterrae]
MGELRLYAIGIDEVRGIFGAPPQEAERLRGIATKVLAPPAVAQKTGLIGKLGPIFRRVPAAPVMSPTAPTPHDVDVLVSGAYIPPDRTAASWRALEVLVSGSAWGATRMALTPQALDDLDFALARGGVSAAVGLRHLLSSTTSVNLVPVPGLTVGYHPYEKALAMASAYRAAMPEVKTAEQQEMLAALISWLDGFRPWADVAQSLARPVPDLVGFWAH